MRKPTPLSVLYAWHAAALRGDTPPIYGEPQAGWFKRKLVRGGPWVPARITPIQPICAETGELAEDEYLECVVNGRERRAEDEWLSLCKYPITEAEYRYMVDLADWNRANRPKEPTNTPNQGVNWLEVPMPKFNQKGSKS